jgi:hypothetical protein
LYLANTIQDKVSSLTSSMTRSNPKPEDGNHYSWLERFTPVDNELEYINGKSDANSMLTKKEFVPAMRKNSLASHCVSFNDTQFGSSLAKFPDLNSKGFLFDGSIGGQFDAATRGDDNIFERLLQLTDYDPIQGNVQVGFEPIPLPQIHQS